MKLTKKMKDSLVHLGHCFTGEGDWNLNNPYSPGVGATLQALARHGLVSRNRLSPEGKALAAELEAQGYGQKAS